MPAGFADRIDDDVLGRLDCSSGETAVYDGARSRWSCGSVAAGAETDPSVNDLARSHMLDACAADQVPVYDGSDWVCATPSDHDSLTAIGSCSDGDTLVWQSGGFSCGAGPSALGDVTSVTVSGPGLVGGGQGGDVQLSLAFPGGACASGTVACSDHTHPVVTPSLASVLGESNDAAGQRVENLAPPVGSADAVTKAYVDALGSRGSAGVALALCCGSECASRLDDWVCQDVAASGKAVVPMSDARGMIVVPDTGRPKLIAQGGVTQDLDDCTGEWKICTLDGVTSLIAACGLLPSTTSPSPFQCWVPTLSYFMLPGMSGLFRTGTPAAPEIRYLADDGSDVAPPDSQVDCSAVTPFEEPFPNSRMVVCVR